MPLCPYNRTMQTRKFIIIEIHLHISGGLRVQGQGFSILGEDFGCQSLTEHGKARRKSSSRLKETSFI